MRRLVWGGLLLLSQQAFALPTQFAFRVGFTDKNGTADIHAPLSFLSQKSLDRRTKYNISIDSTDLPVSPDYLDSVKNITSGIIHVTSRWLNDCVVLVDDTSTIQTLRTKSFVTDVEWVGYFASGLHNKSAVENYEQKPTGSSTYYGATWDQTHLVNGDCLHDKNWKGENILIAVFDNGFTWVDSDPAFSALYTSGRISDTHNFVKDTSYVYSYGSHGTEILSILAGFLPNTYVGAAPNADYALYITEDATSEQPYELDNLIAGFERADSIGVDVMSMSLGYNNFDLPFAAITPSQMDGKTINVSHAANMAMSKGMLMVVTAGNEGSGGLLVPGDADSVLTVGNVDVNKNPAGTSGYGPNASGTIKPNVCALGNPGYVMTSSNTPFAASGTSISTPSIAGFAACLLQGNPGMNPYKIRNAIQKTGHTYTNPGVQSGYGVPDFCAANDLLDVPSLPSALKTTIAPNPFTERLSVTFYATENDRIKITVADLQGRRMLSFQKNIMAGENNLEISLPQSIASGLYLLNLQNAQHSETVKIIKR